MTWDRKRLDREFRGTAENAEKYCEQIRATMAESIAYQRLYDEQKTEFSVYDRLHGRTFGESRQALLKELRRMLDDEVLPDQCNDVERCRAYRRGVINTLINRFNEEAE